MNHRFQLLSSARSKWLASIFVLFALALAACQPAASSSSTNPYSVATQAAGPVSTAVSVATQAGIQVPVTGSEASLSVSTDPNLGQILVGNNGMTVYVFMKDGPNLSNCNAGCMKIWPPLTTQGSPKLGTGIDASLVGSATLSDGTKVVTYNQHPLYYFTKDKKAGDVTGENVGNVWFAVSPTGNPVQPAAQGTPTAAMAAPTSASSNAGNSVGGYGGNSVSTSAPSTSAEATINVVNDPKLGNILVGNNGMTLYAFLNDKPDVLTCTGNCAKNWPALTTQGNPVLGTGVDASMIGSVTLADGSKIVTYNHMPLYYFAKDTKAGDTNGQGVGSVWFVVSPDGKTVQQ